LLLPLFFVFFSARFAVFYTINFKIKHGLLFDLTKMLNILYLDDRKKPASKLNIEPYKNHMLNMQVFRIIFKT
jgi:hypothetical protein